MSEHYLGKRRVNTWELVVNIRDKDEVGYTCVVVVDDTS